MILKVRWEDFGDKSSERLQKVYDLPILARRVKVSINDYRSADTFEAEIDYKNFPFDPRCIRSCGVSVFMQNMGGVFESTNKLEQIVPSKDNAVFIGFADEESISFDDTKRTVRLEGRDYTSLLVDRKYLKGTVNLEQRVDVVLRGILDELAETQEIQLDNRVEEQLPVLARFWGEKDATSGRKNVKKTETYWDVIQDIVARAGLIAYIELDRLVLSKPRVLYSKENLKVFVYGKNVKSLEFNRKLGRRRNFNILVRSLNLNSTSDPVLEAKIPAEATEEWSEATGIANEEVKTPETKPDGTAVPEADAKAAPYMSFLLPDIRDKPHLIECGQGIYEEIGRQQIEGKFDTFEMETPEIVGRGQRCFDVLKLRNGTPISIEIDQGDLEGINRLASVEQKRQFLINRCYDPRVAEVFAETLGKFATPFYTKSVDFEMDGTQGFRCSVDFINFIETSNKSFGGRNP